MSEDVKAKLLLEGWVFEPLEEDEDVYTLGEWMDMCRAGTFIDYDGMGDYALDGEKAIKLNSDPFSRMWVYPSDVKSGNIDKRFTHIVWYNK